MIMSNKVIKIIGVGGGGVNVVNNMLSAGISGVDFVLYDKEEHSGKIREFFDDGTRLTFVIVGMGGDVGTYAAPVIASIAKDLGIITVAIATMPFRNEGEMRYGKAMEGVNELKNNVDALLVIDIEKMAADNVLLKDVFTKANKDITICVKDIVEVITTRDRYVSLDFADVKSFFKDGGITVLGTATANGPNRAVEAVQKAFSSPMMYKNDISSARRIFLNITAKNDENGLKLCELTDIMDFVNNAAKNASIRWGAGYDDLLEDAVRVTVFATDFLDDSIEKQNALLT